MFSKEVLNQMYQNAQVKFWHKEAGGQLFSPSPNEKKVVISKLTGPYEEDNRSRHKFNPNINLINRDRIELFAESLYPVGLWHTHPESKPTPSRIDTKTTVDYLKAFNGQAVGFLLVIIGNKGLPPNITVWLATNLSDNSLIRLEEI